MKPAKPEESFFSSTPALERGEMTERSKGSFEPLDEAERQSEESLSEEESQDDDTSEEQELNPCSEVQETRSRAPDSQPVQSTVKDTSKSGFSLGNSQGTAELKEPATQTARGSADINNLQQVRDSPKAVAGGAFSAVDKSSDEGIKTSESQAPQAELVKPATGFKLPPVKEEVKYSFFLFSLPFFFFFLTVMSSSLLFPISSDTSSSLSFCRFVYSPRLHQWFSRKVTLSPMLRL